MDFRHRQSFRRRGAWLANNQWWNGANTTWVSGYDAVFGAGGAGGAVTLANSTTANSLTFNNFSGTYTLGTTGQTLTINNGITMNSGAGAVTLVSAITLGGPQTWLNNSASASGLTLNSAVSINNNGNLLTIDGTGLTSITAGTLSGGGGLTKNGTGLLNLNGLTNNISGNLVINGGEVLEIGMNIGTGNLTLNGGVLEDYWNGNMTRSLARVPAQFRFSVA